MAMPWSRRRRIAEETRLASCASRGAVGSSNTTSRAAPSISARAICTSLRSARLRSRTSRSGSIASCQFWLEKLRRGGLHPSAIQRPPAGAILLAQKHRFRDGKVRDQVQLLVDNADAGGFDGCRIAEGQRVTVEGDAAAVGLIDTGEDLDQRRFTGAVLANQAMNLPRIEAQGNRIKRGDAGKNVYRSAP
ncbi:Uncharacterised protein [Klebsiella pneumoniae]|uniref:Uncharacterized protein n=1 Tax=Klebsiella pneumoniae TaxID=573 RepID=A0A2X3F327_KLEPN|nr:Uncharacterised protein [Klebsiella pneumoniae]